MKLADYEVLITLVTGSFGRVKLAKNKITGKFFALKMLKKSDIVKSKQVDHVMNENQILSVINHPFIVIMCIYSG
jgi:serine/threonine protein kinase